MRVGFVGWRGMVGSVLMERMAQEKDFDLIESVFFSTSNVGGAAPEVPRRAADAHKLLDAHDIEALTRCDAIITSQGGDYTQDIHPKLRANGWRGYWIDAASALRMKDDAVIILDP
ncbi:MAG TPA: aspartate-semialdehyde dehydrogenase, partial [Burkholderiaceae bacterium]|nr:aspartate-semialdehyde dehydrogenase [Burkholderiaceae bacterium]